MERKVAGSLMTEVDLSSLCSAPKNAVKLHGESMTMRLFENLFDRHIKNRQWLKDRTGEEWVEKVFKEAAFYEGVDELIWGQFFICVYKDPQSSKLSALIIDKFGLSHFNPVDISPKSQFYPAIENLDPKERKSNVRKCIAVSLLQKFAQLPDGCVHRIQPNGLKFDYDPTHAGDLASACTLVDFCTPENAGKSIKSLGILGRRYVQSSLLDVVYESKSNNSEENNRMVFNLGEQLEQLFDPLSEYSPEQTEYIYKAPENDESLNQDNKLVKSILNELLELQMAFTLSLVEFLQGFLISLRVKVLNNEIEGLSTVKLNRLFPPTIDEVTRINCIFLDSLKSATPYGASEVLKACSVTIPYFYKAYTRHEAATKNFSKDIKLFLRRFQDLIPEKDVYTEMKIETIIKGPQEKLLKIKLIIDRLYAEKEWPEELQVEAQRNYNSVVQVIDSFGKLEVPLSSYNTRVFTPSGKILTELAKGWPVELQYKWLKRRIVGIFDVIDANDSAKRKLLVIFSDYIVFLDIARAELYYAADGNNRPQISDILMNSLINEVPLPPKIPKLTVNSYCFIDDVLVSLVEENSIRIDALREGESFSTTFRLASKSTTATTVAELVVKAKILEKETAFHLFRAMQDNMTIYSTAHELEAYQNEKIKSKFSVFLNMKPSKDILHKNRLHLAIFLKFVTVGQKEQIQLEALTSDERTRKATFPPEELVPALIEQLSIEIPVCYSSIYSPLYSILIEINTLLVKKIGHHFNSPNEEKGLANSDQASSFIREHEKKKSFGTITTYRSHVSDFKDATNEQTTSSERHSTHKIPARTTYKTNKADETTPAHPKLHSSRKIDNAKKRRSIVGLVKGIFSGKRSKDDVMKKKSKSTTEQLPKMRSKNLRADALVISKPTISKPNPPKNENEIYEKSQRISSVVRKPEFSPVGDPLINSIEESKIRSGATTKPALQNEAVSQTPLEVDISIHSSTEEPKLDKIVEREEASSNHSTKRIAESAKQFYSQAGRQSQLFNDDLFGELGSGPATEANPEEVDSAKIESNPMRKERLKRQDSSTLDNHSKGSGGSDFDEVRHTKIVDEGEMSTAYCFDTEMGLDSSAKTQQEVEKLIQDDMVDMVDQKKVQIFPSISPPKLSRINFQRSSSFIELFEGMRLILDDSDAQYNWKSLSNDGFLREVKESDDPAAIPHVLRPIADTKLIPGETKNLLNGKSSLSLNRCEGESGYQGSQEISSPIVKTNNVSPDASKAVINESSVDSRSTDHSKVQSPRKNGFKVVKSSPTRIIKKPFQQINIEIPDQNMTYNFSISSNLNQGADKRWFELKLPSQEDLNSEIFHTPHEEPSSEFPEEQHNSDTPSPFESDPNVIETSQETVTTDKPLQKGQEALLEDLEFSSFHMTFDTAEGNSEQSPDTSFPDAAGATSSPKANSPVQNNQKDGPLLYRLPMTFSAKLSQSERAPTGDVNEDDDPIWVSPSKLDFYDLSNAADSKATGYEWKDPAKRDERKEPSIGDEKMGTNRYSLRELSYAYLASLVSPTETSFEMDDKPQRLQFQ